MSTIKVSEGKYRIFVSAGTHLNGIRKRRSTTIETTLKGRDLDRFLRQAELAFEAAMELEILKRIPLKTYSILLMTINYRIITMISKI